MLEFGVSNDGNEWEVIESREIDHTMNECDLNDDEDDKPLLLHFSLLRTGPPRSFRFIRIFQPNREVQCLPLGAFEIFGTLYDDEAPKRTR